MNINGLGEYIIIIIGAIFCHVNIIIHKFQFNPSIISGNQKWNGAAPILVNIDEFIIILKFLIIDSFVNIVLFIIIIIENIKINEARVWVIKYFNVDSEDSILFFFIRGMIDKRLISKPSQTPIHENDDTEINVPKTNVKVNNILYNLFIKEERGGPLLMGYEPISFY